jgi:hypothetical protein
MLAVPTVAIQKNESKYEVSLLVVLAPQKRAMLIVTTRASSNQFALSVQMFGNFAFKLQLQF